MEADSSSQQFKAKKYCYAITGLRSGPEPNFQSWNHDIWNYMINKMQKTGYGNFQNIFVAHLRDPGLITAHCR